MIDDSFLAFDSPSSGLRDSAEADQEAGEPAATRRRLMPIGHLGPAFGILAWPGSALSVAAWGADGGGIADSTDGHGVPCARIECCHRSDGSHTDHLYLTIPAAAFADISHLQASS